MKKLTLDQMWVLCMKQWRWIIWHWRRDNTLNIRNLKEAWCEELWKDVAHSCFFCEYSITDEVKRNRPVNQWCNECPLTKEFGIDHACEKSLDWQHDPEGFYKEIKRLHKIYESQKK